MALHPRPAVNIISLCTGGYGLDFGVELAMPAARSVCLVEREAFAVARLVAAMRQGLIPEAAIWSDARTFNGRPWRGLVDGVIGGIPCQPHSLAGRRRGADDPRDLWSIARRTIVQSGAWWCLIENVPGMLSAPEGQRAGAERVWRDLQRLGFAVEGGLFSAAEVGASHERERLFILGVADARCGFVERWGATGDFRGSTPARDGQGPERQWHGDAFGDGGQDVADGDNAGSSITSRQSGNDGSQCAATQRVRGDVVDAVGVGRSTRWRHHRADVGNQPDATGEHTLVDATGGPQRAGLCPQGYRQTEQQSGDGCGSLVDASSVGRREGRPEHELRSGRRAVAIDGGELDVAARVDGNVAAAEERRQEADDRWSGRPLYPPQPGNADQWGVISQYAGELLPAMSPYGRFLLEIGNARVAAHGDRQESSLGQGFQPYGLHPSVVQKIAKSTLRRMADGMASRVDELRQLGNGVVPLEGAHAVRTLATRLAAQGSAGATFLCGLME